jgi:hypothetical protein
MLKLFKVNTCKPSKTPMVEGTKFTIDMGQSRVDPTLYKHMVRKHVYLINIRLLHSR